MAGIAGQAGSTRCRAFSFSVMRQVASTNWFRSLQKLDALAPSSNAPQPCSQSQQRIRVRQMSWRLAKPVSAGPPSQGTRSHP